MITHSTILQNCILIAIDVASQSMKSRSNHQADVGNAGGSGVSRILRSSATGYALFRGRSSLGLNPRATTIAPWPIISANEASSCA